MTAGAFTSPTDDIIVQEGTFGYSFIASGTINAGQLVKPYGPMQVLAADQQAASQDNAIGVAGYYVTKGETVAVYGPGNIIRSICASATAVGDDLYVGDGGAFTNGIAVGGLEPMVGIALEASKADGTIRILLK
jgi:hypothetical protein